eukprot:2338048-Alexandrium_andersonii.AAC.1
MADGGLLDDAAERIKLISDSVEIRHDQVQSLLRNKRRVRFKGQAASQKLPFAHTILAEHKLLQSFIEGAILPFRRRLAAVLRKAGRASANQHSGPSQKRVAPVAMPRAVQLRK